MKKVPTDQDGKSKTASAADAAAYPEQHEVLNEAFGPPLTPREIQRRAYELWDRNGRPEGTEFQDWIEAERELQAHPRARADLRTHR